MKAALYDPLGGYYQRSDLERWGREGDYRTSPERSDLFAATFARYFAKLYDELQRPEDGRLSSVERVMEDLRQAFCARWQIGLHGSLTPRDMSFTTSSDDALRRARERLIEFGERVEFCSDLELLSASQGIYFSNELLDAFPVHRVVKEPEGLSELYVSVDSSGSFDWSNGPLSTTPVVGVLLSIIRSSLRTGQIIEINLAIDDWLVEVAAQAREGFLITVDYGAEAAELYDSSATPSGNVESVFAT